MAYVTLLLVAWLTIQSAPLWGSRLPSKFGQPLVKQNLNKTDGVLPVALTIIADRCSCKFVGLCTCSAAVDFMDCVADACASGDCNCPEFQFKSSCDSMACACPKVGMQCSHEAANCSQEHPYIVTESKDELQSELQELKRRRCKLMKAVDQGWLNADERLEKVETKIHARFDKLRLKGAKLQDLPSMDCDTNNAAMASHTEEKIPLPYPRALRHIEDYVHFNSTNIVAIGSIARA